MSDRLRYYYLENDYNCAEAVVRAANDDYQLGIPEDGLKLLSGFGGGMCCGKTCGAVCGALAILSQRIVEGKAHATDGFKEKCAGLVGKMEQALETVTCEQLKAKHFKDDTHCYEVVETAYGVLAAYLKELDQYKEVNSL